MTDTIQKLRVLKRLEEMFPAESNPARDFHKHSEADYLSILDSVRRHIRLGSEKARLCVLHFLYSGCLKFDRFAVPTPFVVDQAQQGHFEKFLRALIDAEHGNPMNTATFMVRAVRGQIYRESDNRPLSSVHPSAIENYRREVEKIPVPDHSEKLREFLEEKEKCLAILDGLADTSLRTTIKTRIPFVLHLSPLLLTFNWRGISVRMDATPTFMPSSGSFVNSDGAIQEAGPSRWQAGYTDLEMQFEALIDCDAFAESLQGLHEEELPVDGWPKCFSVAFHILRDVAWQLRLEHEGERQWIPAPRDIGDVEWTISSTHRNQIEWKRKGSPAALMHVFVPSSERLMLDLGDLTEPRWSDQCRSLAIMYFEMGQRDEALFWLNVGVEALFEERFREIAQASGLTSLEKDLVGPKAFWAQAEEVVAAQYP
ncbi:MAG: hypothetical protein WBP44_17245, partial [Gammaproteobacteria bacterium]